MWLNPLPIPGWKIPRACVNIRRNPAENARLSLASYRAVTPQTVNFRFDRELKDHGVASTLCTFKPLAPRLQYPRSRSATNLVNCRNTIVFFSRSITHHPASRARLSGNRILPPKPLNTVSPPWSFSPGYIARKGPGHSRAAEAEAAKVSQGLEGRSDFKESTSPTLQRSRSSRSATSTTSGSTSAGNGETAGPSGNGATDTAVVTPQAPGGSSEELGTSAIRAAVLGILADPEVIQQFGTAVAAASVPSTSDGST
jgi:hypothetical protein